MSISNDDSGTPDDEPAGRPKRRRGRAVRWILFALVLTAGYWVTSYAARPTAESWLSRTLGVPVRVSRVGFDPIDAVITLEDVTTRLATDGQSIGQPIFADQARIDIQWFPLIHKRLQIREFALEGAVIELDRAPNLAPSLEALWSPTHPATLPVDWSLQIDRIVLRDSIVRLGGLGSATNPLEVDLHEAEVTATRRRTSVLGAATNLRLHATVESGTVRAEGHYSLHDEGLAIMADVEASDLPASRVLEHLPELEANALSGRLEAKMRYVLEPGRRSMLSGWARLREAKIQLPGEDEPIMEVRNAIADVAALDLRRRIVRVRSLVLRGARFRAEAGIASTLLSSLRRETDAAARKTRTGGTRPWRWAVDRFDASDARLRVPGPTEPIEVAVTIRGENLGPRSHWSPVHAHFGHDVASAEFEGSVRTSYDEPRLEGRLSAGGIDLPTLVREIGLPGAHLVKSGNLTADIDVLLEPSASSFGMTGLVSIAGATLSGRPDQPTESDVVVTTSQPEPIEPALRPISRADLHEPFAAGADRIDLVVSAPAVTKRKRGPEPEHRWYVDATLTGPYLQVTRDHAGWRLPDMTPESAAEKSPLEPPTPSPKPYAAVAPPITIQQLTVVGGNLHVTDGASALAFDVGEIGGSVYNMTLAPFEIGEMSLQGYGADLGLLAIRGHETSGLGGFDVLGEDIPLYLAGPYLEHLGVPYRFSGGTGSFIAELQHDTDGWAADTLMVLNRPLVDDWTDGEGARERLGMSLSSAFRLLRDQNGDVRVRLPRLTDLEHEFDLAVYDAIQHAHEAPASGGALTPTSVGFEPGKAEIGPTTASRLRSIARLIEAYPLLRIELAAPASLQDRRWFAERALLERLDDRGGLMRALRLLGASDEQERIREALRARINGEAWYLDAYEEEVLDDLLAKQPPASTTQLRELGRQRMFAVERLLVQEGIPAGRLARREISGQDRTTLSAVLVTVRAQPRPVSVQPPEGDGV